MQRWQLKYVIIFHVLGPTCFFGVNAVRGHIQSHFILIDAFQRLIQRSFIAQKKIVNQVNENEVESNEPSATGNSYVHSHPKKKLQIHRAIVKPLFFRFGIANCVAPFRVKKDCIIGGASHIKILYLTSSN